jgi:hypothetical protein
VAVGSRDRAVEEINADVELGRHAAVVAELDTLVDGGDDRGPEHDRPRARRGPVEPSGHDRRHHLRPAHRSGRYTDLVVGAQPLRGRAKEKRRDPQAIVSDTVSQRGQRSRWAPALCVRNAATVPRSALHLPGGAQAAVPGASGAVGMHDARRVSAARVM